MVFNHPFVIAGYPNELPAGNYEIIVEEDLLLRLNYSAHRRTGTYLLVNGQRGVGHIEMRPIDPEDLERARRLDLARQSNTKNGEAAPSPPEEYR